METEMEKDNKTICLLNDSFPPIIDGVANVVVNYARHIQESCGHDLKDAPKRLEKAVSNC